MLCLPDLCGTNDGNTCTQVNYVNATAVAKDTGLAIEVAFSERDPKGYLNGLTVEFEIDGVLNGRRTMTGKDDMK